MTEEYGRTFSLKEMREQGRDPLFEATEGLYHWNDEGMDEPETGWQPFTTGARVEILTPKGWLAGTVTQSFEVDERAIEVACDKQWHKNLNFHEGRVATIMVIHNTRRGILSTIRLIQDTKTD